LLVDFTQTMFDGAAAYAAFVAAGDTSRNHVARHV
jgi:hypothetical protein